MNELEALRWAIDELPSAELMEEFGVSKSTVMRIKRLVRDRRKGVREVPQGCHRGAREVSGNQPLTSSSNIDLNTTYSEEAPSPKATSGDFKLVIDAWNEEFAKANGCQAPRLSVIDRGCIFGILKSMPATSAVIAIRNAWADEWWRGKLTLGSIAKHGTRFLQAPTKPKAEKKSPEDIAWDRRMARQEAEMKEAGLI